MSRTTRITTVLALVAVALAAAVADTAAAAATPSGPPKLVTPTTPPTPVPPPPPPPAPAQLVDVLTRVYRGDDGGALYLRQLDDRVYGFGEHPGRKYAFVLTGAISGDRISGSWWDVPKGSRAEKGTLELRWTQLGARVVRSGGDDLGPDVFTAISADGLDWPVMQAAGFQATTTSDLDGVFAGDDGSRHYVRETSFNAVWVAERAAQPGERPGWVTVFAGQRTPSGGVAGTYVDVPKGIERRSGGFGAALLGTERELVLEQTSVDRTRRLTPDYALDWDRFASEIERRLDDAVVGYGYAIARDGAIVRSGAGGARRLPVDGGFLPFTTKTQAQTASAAKLINATAMVKALYERGLTVDARVEPFLPACWKKGFDMGSLTFRQLLNHTSALPQMSNGACREDPYECLRRMIAEGRTQPRGYDYNNGAYDLLRFLVPLVDDTKGTKAIFDFWKCKDTKGLINRKVSERFARYVIHEVLRPVGSNGSFYPSGDFSLNYDENTVLLGGDRPREDFVLRAGRGKMAVSALDYVRFLGALDRGLIVPKPLVETMKGTPGDRLGFDTEYAGRAGGYVWKNGGCPDEEGKSRGCKTLAIVFPGGIQAYVATNSDNNDYSGGLQTVVGRAFDAALR